MPGEGTRPAIPDGPGAGRGPRSVPPRPADPGPADARLGSRWRNGPAAARPVAAAVAGLVLPLPPAPRRRPLLQPPAPQRRRVPPGRPNSARPSRPWPPSISGTSRSRPSISSSTTCRSGWPRPPRPVRSAGACSTRRSAASRRSSGAPPGPRPTSARPSPIRSSATSTASSARSPPRDSTTIGRCGSPRPCSTVHPDDLAIQEVLYQAHMGLGLVDLRAEQFDAAKLGFRPCRLDGRIDRRGEARARRSPAAT